ncbi:PDZ domain-containing protein [Actinophytocola algeriensis]|uniref:S1-C subfamily serine protease n=1 Tax=Actinophytocola algeriensis TaxID=1768010 RepID=A0A7W7VFY7_9PSEU|nr:PDZ domain-containing protein [Actinophytocola algeriensis]MBB4908806.1 S1-C subfamily serine protease [Actinophytocola algeriensis]MBE1474807.1 S1-C subfamily serine protease [Actinophytocola algeriensis]
MARSWTRGARSSGSTRPTSHPAPGDVIVGFADRDVAAVEDVLAGLREVDPGERVAVTVVRDGERQKLTVTVGERNG